MTDDAAQNPHSATPHASSPAPLLALVGGFLGAGKTTLIGRAVARLQQMGLRCAVVSNDQSVGLVDSAAARTFRVVAHLRSRIDPRASGRVFPRAFGGGPGVSGQGSDRRRL